MTILYHCNNIMYTFFVYTVMNELKNFFFIILATQFSTIKKKNFEKRKKRKEKKVNIGKGKLYYRSSLTAILICVLK